MSEPKESTGGILTTLNPKTGEIFKQARVPGALEQYWASPVGADGKVYLLSQGCKLSVIRALPHGSVVITSPTRDIDRQVTAMVAVGDFTRQELLEAPDGAPIFWILDVR